MAYSWSDLFEDFISRATGKGKGKGKRGFV